MRMRNLVGFVFGGVLAAALASTASAGTIDFEDNAQGAGSQTTLSGDVTSGGYLFDLSSNHGHLGNDAVTFMGSTALVTDDSGGVNVLTMSESANATFNLATADFAEAMNSFGFSTSGRTTFSATTILVTGYLFAGGTVTQTVTLDFVGDGAGGVYDGQTETFNWSGLTKVTFDASGGSSSYWGLDNVVVSTVPLPASVWMGVVLLGGLGLARFARRRSAIA